MNDKIKFYLTLGCVLILSFAFGSYFSCNNSKNFATIMLKLNEQNAKMTEMQNKNEGILIQLTKNYDEINKKFVNQESKFDKINDEIKKIYINQIPNMKVFNDLKDCQSSYNDLHNVAIENTINLEKCKDGMKNAEVVIDLCKNQNEILLNTNSLLQTNYDLEKIKSGNCEKSIKEYDKIISKKIFWKNLKYGLFGAAIGSGLVYVLTKII